MLVTIYLNGVFDTSLEDREDKTVIIYDKGQVYKIQESRYNKFIDDLELNGFDCYFCPELYSHPEWNGIIKYENV